MTVEKPLLDHRLSSATLQPTHEANNTSEPKSESKNEYTSDVEEAVPNPEAPIAEFETASWILDILLLFGTFIMLIWPWIFFGVVWAKKGIQMNNHVAQVVQKNPHATTYFISFISSIINVAVTTSFSLAIVRFAQELVTYHKPTRPFHLTVLLGFRHQTWPWGISWKDVKYLMAGKRWPLAILVIICILTFPQLISSTTSLISPVLFNRMAILTGSELDFSSNDTECLAWFKAHPRSNNCDWQSYHGLQYIGCPGRVNQMVDVLEATRGRILELRPNNSRILTFSQLGARDELRLNGSFRGVLPIGPDGVPAFDMLNPSPLSDPGINGRIISYNYTLDHQGIAADVSCSYEPICNVAVTALVPNSSVTLEYDATCASLGGTEISAVTLPFMSLNANSTLVYWPCQSASNGTPVPSYSIYMCGRHFYQTPIGNITCTVSPQTAIFPVTFQSTSGIFSTHAPRAFSPIAVSTIIDDSLVGLGSVIADGQNFQTNLIVESINTFAVKSFGLRQNESSPQFLRLLERMIQGILEYEAAYIRFIYSTVPNPPSSCIRSVTGSLSYEVTGWFVTPANIGLLFPITIINLAAFVVLIKAIIIAKSGGYMHRPFQPRQVVYKTSDQEELVPDEWMHKVTSQPKTVLKEYFNSQVKGDAIQGVAAEPP